MSKAFWAVIAVIIVVFGALVVLNKDSGTPSANGSSSLASKHIFGEGKSGVTLVEYGDFECSACYRYEPTVAQIRAKYQSEITFQFRNLPLLQVHQNAFAAARAAEAASMQGKFWEMHDLLYENQPTWAEAKNVPTVFEQYAGQLGLDVAKFKKDAASSRVNDIINADIAEFNKTGAKISTPTFFLDGKRIEVTPDINTFVEKIDAAIAAKAKQ